MNPPRNHQLATLLGIAIASGSLHAQTSLTVLGDYDFAATPAGATLEGDASISGGVLNLDGTGDYLSFATTPLTATDDYVVEAIFNATAFGPFNFMVYNGNSNNSGGQGLLQEGGTLDGIVPGIAVQGTPAPATTGANVALAVVRESGTTTVYVDGVAQTTGGAGASPASAASVLRIGAGIAGSGAAEGFFNGTIDRVRISTIAGTFDPADLLGPGDGTGPPPPAITLTSPTVNEVSITETGADASVELGSSAADITLFWATTDYGTNLTDWQTNGSASPLGNQAIGTVNGSLTGLTGDTTYTVRFHAVNTTPDPDDEAWSAPVTFGTPFAAGQKVTDLAATAVAYNQIDLTWTDAFNSEEEYYLETSDDGGMNWFALTVLPPDTTSYSDFTVSELSTYQYRILGASTVSGDSDWSDTAEATTPAEPPFTPTVAGDYTFDDNQAPSGFTEFGDPTYADGKLLLDGDGDYLQAPAPTTATDNIILETIASADAVGVFNFTASISDAGPANSGFGIVAQNGNWNALTSGIGFPGSEAHGTTPTPAVAVAYVREKGNSSLYLNGVQFDGGGADGAISFNDAGVITIGGHNFDVPNGVFIGSIDRVRVTTFIGPFDSNFLLSAPVADDFAAWIAGFSLTDATFTGDDDGDGLGNGLENFLGTNPGVWNAGLTQVSSDGSGATFQHPQNVSPASDVAGSYEWSLDAQNWNNSGDEVSGTTVTITPSTDDPVAGTTTVTAAATGTIPDRLFVRAKAEQPM